jgi:hypothetical protein
MDSATCEELHGVIDTAHHWSAMYPVQYRILYTYRLSRDIITKNVFQINMFADALGFQYEPLLYLKIF